VLWSACAISALAGTLAAHVQVRAQSPAIPPDIVRVLTQAAAFTPDDLLSLQSGRVITQTSAAPESLEASVATAVRIATTKDRTLDYFHLLVTYVDGQVTTGYGTFSRPPSEGDVSRLTLDASDLADLRACATILCDVRIGAATPAEIGRAVDWNAPDAAGRANTWVRRELASYVGDYLQNGDAALVTRDDRGTPVNLRESWRAMFSRSSALPLLAPGLERYLSGFPAVAKPAEVTEEIYWDRERYTGLKAVIGVTHAATWRDPGRPDRAVVAQRQIFASHYFYGSLAVTLVQQDTTSTTPVTYVVYVNRLRGDLLRGSQAPAQGGLLGRVTAIGANVQRRLGEEMVKQSAERLMSDMKEALER
jgi:hypothetical protein